MLQRPCRGVKLPRQQRDGMRFLTATQLDGFGSCCPGKISCSYPHRRLYRASLGGVGKSQIQTLNLPRGTLEVAETLTEVNGRSSFDEPKTSGSRRLPFSPLSSNDILRSTKLPQNSCSRGWRVALSARWQFAPEGVAPRSCKIRANPPSLARSPSHCSSVIDRCGSSCDRHKGLDGPLVDHCKHRPFRSPIPRSQHCPRGEP